MQNPIGVPFFSRDCGDWEMAKNNWKFTVIIQKIITPILILGNVLKWMKFFAERNLKNTKKVFKIIFNISFVNSDNILRQNVNQKSKSCYCLAVKISFGQNCVKICVNAAKLINLYWKVLRLPDNVERFIITKSW